MRSDRTMPVLLIESTSVLMASSRTGSLFTHMDIALCRRCTELQHLSAASAEHRRGVGIPEE